MTRVLITGAHGYIGGRLSAFLGAAEDYRLRLATRRPPSAWPAWSRNSARVEVAVADLADAAALEDLCRGIDAVIHLAGTNERVSAADPGRALIDTALGTMELLRAAERQGVGRFVYLSTAHVYGAPLAGRIDETTLPRPIHPYAITHRAAEDFVLAAGALGAIEAVVLRLSNGLGAPADSLIDRWTLVGNDLCRQAAEDGVLVLTSSGEQERDFVPLSDVCRGVLHVLRLPAAALGDGLFNLGGERSLTVRELAGMIAVRSEIVLGIRPDVVSPAAPSNAATRSLDYRFDKLRLTGYAPQGSLEDEIDRTLALCLNVKERV
jgi:UDP-glucose 4-epimerase